jgi:hypothetical protein
MLGNICICYNRLTAVALAVRLVGDPLIPSIVILYQFFLQALCFERLNYS